MKLTTFENRTKRFTRNSGGYKLAKELLIDGKKVYTCWTSGSGRWTKNADYTEDTIEVLRYAGLDKGIHFFLENDSPRGGSCGNHLVLTTKGRKKMIK